MEEKIKLIITALNKVETHGAENLNSLLASIQLATQILQDLQQKEGN